ncbi:MAG: hypothetical protein KAI64_07195, partial [Thermoplasmata archaeon]|nr:hypothetical protein [Thermoplasmata archaeon]
GIARDLYDLPTPRCACKGYKADNQKVYFRGWVDNPWAKAESTETGRLHRSLVESGKDDDPSEPTVEFIPASSTTFYTLAISKIKMESDQARDVLQPFIDKVTGEIDYEKAIILVEKNLPEPDRDFTKQQEELAKREKAKGEENGGN